MRYNTYTDFERKVKQSECISSESIPVGLIQLYEARSGGYTSLHSLHIRHLDIQTHKCEANTERWLYRKRMIF